MLEMGGQQWQLFGFDVRHVGRYWQRAWADFLWGDRSPVRERLDEAVLLHSEAGSECFHAGKPAPQASADCEAVLLPEELVLFKSLRIPRAAESELESVMMLEVASNSPFPADDTASGWVRLSRDENGLQVQLAIVSLSATMRYLGKHYDIHDVHAREVWARGAQYPIVLRGFGEGGRLSSYKRRLLRLGIVLACCAGLIVGMAVVAAGGKYMEMKQYQHLMTEIDHKASGASDMRSSLAGANETIGTVNAVSRLYPNPHYELARLTELLGDDAYIVQFSMRGDEIRLRGRSKDAATVMEKLTDVKEFAEVTAPQAITKLANTGLEQFYVNIRLQGGEGA